MQLRIQVTNAAYMDKLGSDSIMYELVPRYDIEDEAASNRRPSWLSSPCVRQSEMLVVLHQHLLRKHPYILLPPFPAASRDSAGWGSEALLQSLRRRLERYFIRLLGRPELQEDVALHDFMSSKGDAGRDGFLEGGAGRRRSSLLAYLSRWWAGSDSGTERSAAVASDTINRYVPLNGSDEDTVAERVRLQDSIQRQIHLREVALQGLLSSTGTAMQAVLRCSEALGRMSKAVHELTSSHNRHLLSDSSYGSMGIVRTLPSETSILAESTLHGEDRFAERRFRELGNRFIDLVNQLQPGLQQVHRATTSTVLELSASQIVELDDVRSYVNRAILALKRHDLQIGRRREVQRRREAAEASLAGPNAPRPRDMAQLMSEANAAMEEELARREECEGRMGALPSEMDTYWRQTSEELLTAVAQVVGTSLEVTRLHVDALQAWFPPE